MMLPVCIYYYYVSYPMFTYSCIFIGSLLVNSLPVLFLFDSGANQSFESQSFSMDFIITSG